MQKQLFLVSLLMCGAMNAAAASAAASKQSGEGQSEGNKRRLRHLLSIRQN